MQIFRRATITYYGVLAVVLGGGIAAIGMASGAWGPIPGILIAVGTLYAGLRKPVRRLRMVRTEFPPDWRDWLQAHVPLYATADAARKRRFERDLRIVAAEWSYEGVGSVMVTDQLRVSVAAGVALLSMGRPEWEWPSNVSVVFYPAGFDERYQVRRMAEYDGMVHEQGPIILSVASVEEGWDYLQDGSNVVLHELAHVLDFARTARGSTAPPGAPSREVLALLARREQMRARLGRSILGRYAGTNEAELFAVAVENFYERPVLLRRDHQELYKALVAYFGIDPAPTA